MDILLNEFSRIPYRDFVKNEVDLEDENQNYVNFYELKDFEVNAVPGKTGLSFFYPQFHENFL